jgi:glycosyltransferase involved in cell wall biosynthesis
MQKNSKPTISIIVTAFNEEDNLESAISNILASIDDLFSNWEILIIDCVDKDGKDDGTRAIAKKLAESNSHIRAIQNPYVNLGYKYWQGVGLAKFEYIIWLPGDNETTPETIKNLFEAAGKADIICSYTVNTTVRSLKRRIISKMYTFIINTLFGLQLRYFNGPSIYKTELLKSLTPAVKKNKSFSYNTEILVRSIKGGHSYVEIPQYIQKRKGKTKALNLKNFFDVIKNIVKLFWELHHKN